MSFESIFIRCVDIDTIKIVVSIVILSAAAWKNVVNNKIMYNNVSFNIYLGAIHKLNWQVRGEGVAKCQRYYMSLGS